MNRAATLANVSSVDPERLLAEALRAQAGGERVAPADQPRPRGLPVGRVLVLAVLLCLLAGAIAGVVTLA